MLAIGPAVSASDLTGVATVPNPQSGAISLSGLVAAPPPTTGAIILRPASGLSTSTTPITVSGSCPAGLVVSVYKNDVFGGSAVCDTAGSFNLQFDLFYGQNNLVAIDSDALSQTGPPSPTVVVNYAPPGLALPGLTANLGRQLFLESNTPVLGTDPNTSLNWQVRIVGGTSPYALSWDWGDGSSTLVSVPNEGGVTTAHTYQRPGNYRVMVRVSDSAKNSSFLQLITVVNGPVAATTTKKSFDVGSLISIWPLYILACIMVLTFWLGERRELGKLRHRHQLVEAEI